MTRKKPHSVALDLRTGSIQLQPTSCQTRCALFFLCALEQFAQSFERPVLISPDITWQTSPMKTRHWDADRKASIPIRKSFYAAIATKMLSIQSFQEAVAMAN